MPTKNVDKSHAGSAPVRASAVHNLSVFFLQEFAKNDYGITVTCHAHSIEQRGRKGARVCSDSLARDRLPHSRIEHALRAVRMTPSLATSTPAGGFEALAAASTDEPSP
jgi:hypothetical protein